MTLNSGNFRKINPSRDYDCAQMLEMVKPGEVDVLCDSLVSWLVIRRGRALNLFCAQSEFLGLLMATMANDEIKQDDAGLFAYDPVR